jgi:hypothetical protein
LSAPWAACFRSLAKDWAGFAGENCRGHRSAAAHERGQPWDTAKGFDASFAAIVLFPDVLDTLAMNIPWTTEVGKAFVSDQKAVLASVQRLRKQAQTVGNLKTTPQQEVKVETQDGQQVIVIQPANPQIVYVPVYNTQVVYTTPPPPPEKDNSDVVAAAALGFMAGIVMGAAVSDPYPYGWRVVPVTQPDGQTDYDWAALTQVDFLDPQEGDQMV